MLSTDVRKFNKKTEADRARGGWGGTLSYKSMIEWKLMSGEIIPIVKNFNGLC